MDRITMKF